MGHWLFNDEYADEKDTGSLLFGGCGLLSKDGITKPGYYAMEFLNRLYDQVILIHENYIVTRNSHGSLRIVCHNMKRLNYNYYISAEDSIRINEIPFMLENREFLTVHFQINGMQNEIYKIKENYLNRSHGSVQDRWSDLNLESDLTMREMEYLRAVSVSTIFIHEVEAKNHSLQFDVELEPNEIRYIHVLVK